jgi:uncharacterized repeat protein (TIGR01451 family)
VETDSYPAAAEGRTWTAGSTSDFTIDAKAILAQHFPGIDLFKATSVGVALVALGYQETAVFSNLCLTEGAPLCSDPPSITTCAAPRTAPANGSCQATVPDFTAQVVASSGCSAVTVTQDPAAGTLVGLGSHTITLTATDAASHSSTCTTSFTVVNTSTPVVTLNGDSNMTVECHTTFTDPGATATDACGASLPIFVSGSVDANTPGTYTLFYKATGPGGNGSATRSVTVVDTTPPVVTPPANITQPADAGQCSAQLTVGAATATDTCAGALTPVGTRSDGKALTAPYPVGTTTITWTATDLSGNPASATQTVTVLDQQAPTISCPGNQTVLATSASGAAVSFTIGATDNCGAASVVCTNQNGQVVSSGSTFPVGITTVTCKAIDAAGNQNTCSFKVTVTANADLALTISASPSPVVTNTNLTYTIVVRNNGPQSSQGVVITDPLPGGASFVSANGSLSGGTLTTPKAGTAGTVTWNIQTLGSGQSATLTVVEKVTAKAGATLNNIASVSSSSPPDPNPGNNSALVTTSVVAKR